MRVPKKDFSNWRANYHHGDITLIHEFSKSIKSKVSRQAISGAINKGTGGEQTIKVINLYYKQL